MITGIQVARGLAAIMVVFLHAQMSYSHFLDETAFIGFWKFGHIGVDFFFVLSGFIIYWVHSGDQRQSSDAARYLFKRFIRVYLPYWPVALLLLVAYRILPQISESDRQIGLISTLLLIPTDSVPSLNVAWTLMHEVTFYATFLMFYLFGLKAYWIFMAFWVMAILWFQFFTSPDSVFTAFVFSPHNLQFFIGITCAEIYSRKVVPYSFAKWIFFTALALLLAYVFKYPFESIPYNIETICLGALFGAIVLGLCSIEHKMNYGKFLILMGAASYSIYLIHLPVMSIVARLWRCCAQGYDANLTFLISVLICIVFGVIYHFLLEKPAISSGTKLFLKKLKAK